MKFMSLSAQVLLISVLASVAQAGPYEQNVWICGIEVPLTNVITTHYSIDDIAGVAQAEYAAHEINGGRLVVCTQDGHSYAVAQDLPGEPSAFSYSQKTTQRN